jgi:hypothetical protein
MRILPGLGLLTLGWCGAGREAPGRVPRGRRGIAGEVVPQRHLTFARWVGVYPPGRGPTALERAIPGSENEACAAGTETRRAK